MDAIEARLQEEYALETERKTALLSASGVAEDELSKNGQLYLHVLSEAAALLQLKDTKTSSYIEAVSDLIKAVDEVDEEEKALKDEATRSQTTAQELLTESRDLENVKKQLEEASTERETHENTVTMEQRTQELNQRDHSFQLELKALEDALADLEIDGGLEQVEHHKLEALSKACEDVEAENEQLRKQLEQYHGLPLHKELAAATLRQAQEDLAQLEDQFNRHIRSMV